MATVSPTTGAVSTAYQVAAQTLAPQFYDRLVHMFPGEISPDLTFLTEMLGREKIFSGPEWFHYEKNAAYPFILVGTVNTPSAGAGTSVTITLPASNHANGGTQSPVGNTTTGYVNTNLEVQFKNQVVGRVISGNVATAGAHQVTIRPLDAAEDIGALTAGYQITVLGTMFAERTGQPEGTFSQIEKKTFEGQIVKETFTASGSAMADASFASNDGTFVQATWNAIESWMRFKIYVEMIQVAGKATNNTGMPDTATSIEGLIPQVNAGGINQTYAIGGMTRTNWRALERAIRVQFGAREYALHTSLRFRQEMTDWVADSNTNGGIVFANFSQDKANQLYKYGFEGVNLGVGYNFLCKNYDLFDDATKFGTPDHEYQNFAFGVPLDVQRDAVTSEAIPSFRMVTKGAEGYRRAEAFMLGSANMGQSQSFTNGSWAFNPASTDIDEKSFNWRWEGGQQTFAIHRYFTFQGV